MMMVHVVSASLVVLSCVVFEGIAIQVSQQAAASPSVKTGATTPAPKKEFAVSVSNVTSTGALLKWNTNATAVKIRVCQDGSNTTRDYSEKFNSELRIPDLQPWTEYKIRVSAQENSTNSSSPAIIGEVTFKTRCAAPSAPRHLQVVNATANSITLRWQPPQRYNGPLDGYTVFYVQKGNHQGGKSMDANVTSATVTSLTYGTEYSLYVKAYNKHDTAELSSEQVETTATTIITAPSIVQNLHLLSRGDASAAVEWKPPLEPNGPLDGYRVFWCLGIDTASVGHQPGECRSQALLGHDTRAEEEKLLPSTNYSVYVSPFNMVRNSQGNGTHMLVGEEAKIYVQTLSKSPEAVDHIRIHGLNKTSATVAWERLRDATGYIVEWCQNQNCTEQETKETQITLTDLQMGASYNVSVVGYHEGFGRERQVGPLRTMQVLFQDSHGHAEPVAHSKYVAGTIVCSFLVVALAIATVYVWRRPWAKPGPTPYKRMSSLEQDDDDILFMKTVQTKAL